MNSVFVIVLQEDGSDTVIKDLIMTGGLKCLWRTVVGSAADDNSNPTITNCTIKGNMASDDGGGICCRTHSNPTISRLHDREQHGQLGRRDLLLRLQRPHHQRLRDLEQHGPVRWQRDLLL